MQDSECIQFLRWCLPRLQLHWRGYRKVRRTVCKRVTRRLRKLGLADLDAYRQRLADDPDEWVRLDTLCRIPISRYYRDQDVFDALRNEYLPELAERVAARGRHTVRCWCAGCASGEEPYTLSLVWGIALRPVFASLDLFIIATDADETMLSRARRATYGSGSLRDLPLECRALGFIQTETDFHLRPEFKDRVSFKQQDIRQQMPGGVFDLIMCRNLVFTYFDAALQATVFADMDARLQPGGLMVIGKYERLPADMRGYRPIYPGIAIYRKPPAVNRR